MTDSSTLRLVHVTLYRDLPAGVRKQILWEQKAALMLKGAQWDQLALHGGAVQESFEKRIPRLFRPMFLRHLYAWMVLWRIRKQYDYLLVRHMPFDPFAIIFAPLIRNRITIHHAKEVLELKLIRGGIAGQLAAMLERVSGKVAVATARAVLGVTPELAEYQTQLRAPNKPRSVYANGIDLQSVSLLDDARNPQRVEAAFICHTFSAWHGLDRLIDVIVSAAPSPDALVIHLIGSLSETQKRQIASQPAAAAIFQLHGMLESDAYRTLLARCDIGIGSLAMDRQNLTQGSTLKVRELLASGLPLFSNHEDPSLPDAFPYYRLAPLDLPALLDFARDMKSYTRQQVREASAPYIDKRASMQKVVDWLQNLNAGAL